MNLSVVVFRLYLNSPADTLSVELQAHPPALNAKLIAGYLDGIDIHGCFSEGNWRVRLERLSGSVEAQLVLAVHSAQEEGLAFEAGENAVYRGLREARTCYPEDR